MTALSSSPPGQVITEFSNGVGRLTLNNPARKNAITASMAQQIAAFCARVDGDESIGAAIIDAAGDYFCSGADTRDLAAASAAPSSPEAVASVSRVYDAFVDFGSLPVPTVSVVVGGAVGAGLNLALAADVVLVTPDATLESGFVNRHIHPGGGHFALLGRVFNRQQAMVLGVLGHAITGTQAVRLGAAWKTLAQQTLPTRPLRWSVVQQPIPHSRVGSSAVRSWSWARMRCRGRPRSNWSAGCRCGQWPVRAAPGGARPRRRLAVRDEASSFTAISFDGRSART
ncbi:MAG: enoyl-CoA hydratase [Mycobacterium sp.]|nr:enoyl-CoA hydratase [Mycobacterium sp.]